MYQNTHFEVVKLLVHERHPQAVGPVFQEPFEVCKGQSRFPQGEVCDKACRVAAEKEHPSEVYRHEECAQRNWLGYIIIRCGGKGLSERARGWNKHQQLYLLLCPECLHTSGLLEHTYKDNIKGCNNNNNNKYLSNIPGKHDVKALQKTAKFGTVHILREVLT